MSLSSLDKEPADGRWAAATPPAPPLPHPPGLPPGAPPGAAPAPRRRPQSFAQKLRSTGKSVKGKLGEYTRRIIIIYM